LAKESQGGILLFRPSPSVSLVISACGEMMKKIFYGWWVVFACFFIGFYVSSTVFYGFTAFFEPLIQEFGWSYAQVSFAASLRGLEMGVLAFPVGFLVDRFGSRKLMVSGVVTVGFGLLLLSATRSLPTFYAAFLLMAFGAGGCTSVVTLSAVADWFDKDVGKAMGVMASGFGASGVMIPVIVWLIAAYDWRTTLIILGLGLWVLGIPLCFVIRENPRSTEGSAWKRSNLSQGPEKLAGEKAGGGFREILKNRSFLYLNLVEAIRMMVVSAVITHVMPYLSSMAISRTTAGFIAAAIPLSSIIGRIGFGWAADLFEKRKVMACGFLVMAAGLLTFCGVNLAWMLVPFLVLFPPSYGGMIVLRGALVRDYFGRESFGKMIGMVMGSSSVGAILGPTVAGWIFDTLGSYLFIWIAFSVSLGLSTFLVLRIRR
jgi:MFS family permease